MEEQESHSYQFGRFLLEVEQRRLSRGDEILSITPKAFDTLLVLLKNRGRVVEKDLLLSEVWADTFVEEGTLAQNISTIRKVLSGSNGSNENSHPNGDSPVIETVPRRGYRFVGEVNEKIGTDKYVVVDRQLRNLNGFEQKTLTNGKLEQTNGSNQYSEADLASSLPSNTKYLFLRKWHFVIGLVLIVMAVAILFIGSPYLSKLLSPKPFSSVRFTKQTSSGSVQRIAISRDGKYIAFADRQETGQALFIKQISSDTVVQIVGPSHLQFIGVTFSPDGEDVYYVTHSEPAGINRAVSKILTKIPMLGGAPQQISENIDSPVAFSTDGKRIAFIRNNPEIKETALIVADLTGANEQKIATRPSQERFMPEGLAWSPDDRFIAAPARKSDDVGVQMQAISVNVANGQQRSITSQKWDWVGQMSWLNDGSSLIFPAYGEQSQNLTDEIWLAEVASGEARQITNGINGYLGLGLTADSRSLLTVKSDFLTTMWRTSLADPKKEARLTQEFSEYSLLNLGMVWSPDRTIVYATSRNGNVDIWTSGADGSNPRQITSERSADFFPRVTPDGRTIVFISNRTGRFNLWRMRIDGTDVRQLTNGQNITSPGISPDGKYVFYAATSGASLTPFVWKVSLDGGEPVQLNNDQTYKPQISPDGKSIACYYPVQNGSPRSLALTIISAEDGRFIKQFENTTIQMIPDISPAISWTPDGQKLLFVQDTSGVPNVWVQALSENAPQPLTASRESIYRYALSPDGQDLIFERGTQVNDIVLIENSPR